MYLSCLLKDGKEVNAVMLVGRPFHARATVTRNDRSPMVLSWVQYLDSGDLFALQDMFTVEPKHSHSEQPVSIDSLDDLRLGEVITSDGCGAFFTATISRHHPGTSYSVDCHSARLWL